MKLTRLLVASLMTVTAAVALRAPGPSEPELRFLGCYETVRASLARDDLAAAKGAAEQMANHPKFRS